MSTKKETEIVIYAKLTQMDGLNEAAHQEHHLQAQQRIDGTRVRVRRTRTAVYTGYTKTTKADITKTDGVVSCEEKTVSITPAEFKAFVAACPTYMDKLRHCFTSKSTHLTLDTLRGPIICTLPELYYEVDVFLKQNGSFHSWCKIDVEIDGLVAFLEKNYPDIGPVTLRVGVSKLPCAPRHGFIEETATDTQRAFVNTLYETVFFKPVTSILLDAL